MKVWNFQHHHREHGQSIRKANTYQNPCQTRTVLCCGSVIQKEETMARRQREKRNQKTRTGTSSDAVPAERNNENLEEQQQALSTTTSSDEASSPSRQINLTKHPHHLIKSNRKTERRRNSAKKCTMVQECHLLGARTANRHK
jgi:hypothetical protein